MKRVMITATMILATLTGLFLLWEVRQAVILFLFSLAVAATARPATNVWVRRGLPRWIAILLVYTIGVLVFVGVVLLISRPLLLELQDAGDNLAQGYERITQSWPYGDASQKAIAEQLPAPEKLYEAMAGERGTGLMTTGIGIASSFISLIGQFFIVLLLSMYWSADQLRFERLWLSLLPADRRSRAREIWRNIENGVGAYVRGQAVQSTLAFLVLGVVYWLVGLNYPVLFALAGAFLLLIPWMGAALAVILPVISGIGVDPWLGFAAGFFTFVFLLALEFMIEPRYFDRSRYSSLLIVLTMVMLADAIGLVGIILAPVIAIALQILAGNLATLQTSRAVVNPVQEIANLDDRLDKTRAHLEEHPELSSPEVNSLLERLGALIEETGELFDSGQESRTETLGLPMSEPHPVTTKE